MFARSAEPKSDPGLQPEPEPQPKAPARDAKFFQPSTFSSRAAERAARGEKPRGQRLVSLGKTPIRMPTAGRNDANINRIVEVESFFDADHVNDFYARYEGGRIEPVLRHTGENQKVVKLGTMATRPRKWTPTAGPAPADSRVVLND